MIKIIQFQRLLYETIVLYATGRNISSTQLYVKHTHCINNIFEYIFLDFITNFIETHCQRFSRQNATVGLYGSLMQMLQLTRICMCLSPSVSFLYRISGGSAGHCIPRKHPWDPFYDLTLIPAKIFNHMSVKCWMKLLIHSQTSTVPPTRCGNGQIILSLLL